MAGRENIAADDAGRALHAKMLQLCEENGWTLLPEALDAPFSPFIGRIVDHKGRRRLLKVLAADPFKVHEVAAMHALRHTGRAPKVIELSEDGTVYLVKDLGGPNLNEARKTKPELVWRAAKLARRIHNIPVPAWAPDMNEWMRMRHPADPILRHPEAEVAVRCQRAYEELADCQHEDRFVHGDFHPRNIVLARDGKLHAIDPFGFRGDRAYDIAILAAYERDPIAAAHRLQKRYGEKLPRIEQHLLLAIYCAYFHLGVYNEPTEHLVHAARKLTPGLRVGPRRSGRPKA